MHIHSKVHLPAGQKCGKGCNLIRQRTLALLSGRRLSALNDQSLQRGQEGDDVKWAAANG